MKKLIVFLLVLPVLLGISVKKETGAVYAVPLDGSTQREIIKIAQEYEIDPSVVFAVIEKESNFCENAVGDGGASVGLMQVKAQFHSERMVRLGVTDLFDPVENVKVGVDYLAELLGKYGDMSKALVAFNAGETGAYNGWFSVGKTESDYSRAVLMNAQKIAESAGV